MPETSKSRIFNNILFGLVIFVSVFCILLSLLPRLTGDTVCGVQADNMAPEIQKGALVWAKPIAFEDIRVGDLLVFADPKTGACFTSRIVDFYPEQQLVTQNGSGELDPYTTAYYCVRGKVCFTVPYIGYLPVFLNTVFGKAAVALLYIIWIAAEIEVRSAAKRREKRA